MGPAVTQQSPWGPHERWHSSCRHHWAWRRSKWADSHQPLCSRYTSGQPDESPPVSDCFLYVYLIGASLSLNHTLPWLIFIPQPFDADMMESDMKPLARLLLLLPLSSRQWQHLGSAQKVKISLRDPEVTSHIFISMTSDVTRAGWIKK